MTGPLTGLLWLTGQNDARAALVTTTFCFEYELSYADGATGDYLTGSTTKARGNRVQFVRESDGVTVFNNYVSDADGCIVMNGLNGTVKLDTTKSYTVKLPREAVVGGNTIFVRNSTGGSLTAVPKTGLVPVANKTYSEANGDLWASLAVTDPSLIMAVAQWALDRKPAGAVGETFTFRNGPCENVGNSSCYDNADEILWIADPDRKFAIGHIMGLAMAHFENAHDVSQWDDDADLDDCIPGESVSGHKVNTKEFQSFAVLQGIARFYSAAVFNADGTDAACDYQVIGDVDWNTDSDDLDTDEDEVFSCSGSPAPNQSPAINDFAYFDQLCSAGDVNNRATAYDWLKMWWDYRTDGTYGGYSVQDIFNLWEDADPDTWAANGDPPPAADHPYIRLFDQAGGIFSDFDELGAGVHGVQH